MKRETITRMLNGVNDDYISQTAVFDPESVREDPGKIIHMNRKRIITFALAAALVIALGVGAYASGLFGGKPETTIEEVDRTDPVWRSLYSDAPYANEIASTIYEPHDNAPTAETAAMLADMDKGERSSREFDTVREMEEAYGIELLKSGSEEGFVGADLWLEEIPLVYDAPPTEEEIPDNGAHLSGWWSASQDGVRLLTVYYCCFNNPFYRQGMGFSLTKTDAVGEYDINSLGVTASLVSGWREQDGESTRQLVAYYSYEGIDYAIIANPAEGQDITLDWLCALLETLHK